MNDSTPLTESSVMNLLGSYARLLDDGKWEEWHGLFGSDGVLALGEKEISGASALYEFAEQSPKGVHMQAVPQIDIGSDGIAEVTSSFVFVVAETGSIVAGAYDDRVSGDGNGGAVFIRRGIHIALRH